MGTKEKCGMCDWRGTSDDVLRAPNPFYDAEEIWGCPRCKEVNLLYLVCDEPGCWDLVNCGTPTPDDGYRSTCHMHVPKA